MNIQNYAEGLTTSVLRDIRGEESRTKVDYHIKAAVDWLFTSQDVTSTAGSAASYNLFLGWEDPYPETTGYIIPTLYTVASQYDIPEAETRAERMAEWLLQVQFPNGAFPGGTYSGKNTEPSVFNTGQILRGLVQAYRKTGDSSYRKSGIAAIDWLAKVQHEDGYWDTYDYNKTSHSYSSRISWPVLEAAAEFDYNLGYEVAANNLQWVLSQRQDNDWFERCGFDRGKNAYLHTIAYTIRGLQESAQILQGELSTRCAAAATAAANQLQTLQSQDGILQGEFDSEWNPTSEYHCLTGNAQMLIIWGKLSKSVRGEKYRDAVVETADFLMRSQTLNGPECINGGIPGSSPVWGRYMYFRYPNWAAKFFIDALVMYDSLRDE